MSFLKEAFRGELLAKISLVDLFKNLKTMKEVG